MLFVLFHIGSDRYALDAKGVAEVLPLLDIKEIPQTPAGVAGAINYRGEPVPVIDLCAMALGRPAARKMNTRIILVRYPDSRGVARLLGLIAEKATETIRREASEFSMTGIANDGAPYLGPVASDGQGLIQWVAPDKLLSPAVRDVLFTRQQETI
jgi:chemotaxis-related protein WspB